MYRCCNRWIQKLEPMNKNIGAAETLKPPIRVLQPLTKKASSLDRKSFNHRQRKLQPATAKLKKLQPLLKKFQPYVKKASTGRYTKFQPGTARRKKLQPFIEQASIMDEKSFNQHGGKLNLWKMLQPTWKKLHPMWEKASTDTLMVWVATLRAAAGGMTMQRRMCYDGVC